MFARHKIMGLCFVVALSLPLSGLADKGRQSRARVQRVSKPISELMNTRQNTWTDVGIKEVRRGKRLAKNYLKTLQRARTAPFRAELLEKQIVSAGGVHIDKVKEWKPGTLVYWKNADNAIFSAVLGKGKLRAGMNIVGTHIDSPRGDLVPKPLMEDGRSGLALGQVAPYGGFNNVNMLTATHLGLFGVAYVRDGDKMVKKTIAIGDKKGDPTLVIPELLPHLQRGVKGGREGADPVKPDELRVILGGIPHKFKDVDGQAGRNAPVKSKILKLLWARYGLTERDLQSAKLELVPLTEARFSGLDKSFVSGYGQDDMVATYAGQKALFYVRKGFVSRDKEGRIKIDTSKVPQRTAVMAALDKEEVGSDGITGAQGQGVEIFLDKLMTLQQGRNYAASDFKNAITNSRMLSADVNAPISPNFPGPFDAENSAKAQHGPSLTPYTGGLGKGGTSEASAQYTAWVRDLFDRKGVVYQMATLGKPGAGGGGTIAKYFANRGMNVIDFGPNVTGMHTRLELVPTQDVWHATKAMKAFYEAE